MTVPLARRLDGGGCTKAGKIGQNSNERLRANLRPIPIIIPSSFFRIDRETAIGSIINKYLTKEIELDDRSVHLLFSANRWERRYVRFLIFFVNGKKRKDGIMDNNDVLESNFLRFLLSLFSSLLSVVPNY